MRSRPDIEAQVSRIRRKLRVARDQEVTGLGTESHKFQLGPALTEEQVLAFEQDHGVTLPACYRAFLTQIGHGGPGRHGGAGPHYGLVPLSEWSDTVDWMFDTVPDDWLALESPLRPGQNPLPMDDAGDDDWPGEALLTAYQGLLTLGSLGCTGTQELVVSGSNRGRVVYVDVSRCAGPYVVRDEDFLYWYERWLDELLAGYSVGTFGYGPAGGVNELLAIIKATADPELRIEAIRNLHRVPDLGAGELWSKIAPLCGVATSGVRAAATGVFVRCTDKRFFSLIARGVVDDVADVRRAAFRAVMSMDSGRGAGLVWRQLQEEKEEDAARIAFHVLDQAEVLTEAQLSSLAQGASTEGVRVSAAYKLQHPR